MKNNDYFYILDVFAEDKYSGNQLAVVIIKNALSVSKMQRIAKEFNFSETTFIISTQPENSGYNVRIFTPEREVPFAGHPVLGTAYVIQREIIKEPVRRIILNLKTGRIPVRPAFRRNKIIRLTMKQKEPVFGRTFNNNKAAAVLGLPASDIDSDYPIQEVSTGLPFIIVPLKNLAAVKNSKIDKENYFELIKNAEAKAIFVFCPETYKKENHINARMFAPYFGINEDPATGSANGCLAGYLLTHNYFGQGNIDIRVEQGYEIGRPSLIFLKAKKTKSSIEIYVGGKVIEVTKGILL
ncbi:MAG: PhzF family phenazine biosynthesis protein [Thermodesulfovibrionales bacterium]|nr:PhzF family phenazine biosynthesis protein [Thermodesulfovibrionales bacterium]